MFPTAAPTAKRARAGESVAPGPIAAAWTQHLVCPRDRAPAKVREPQGTCPTLVPARRLQLHSIEDPSYVKVGLPTEEQTVTGPVPQPAAQQEGTMPDDRIRYVDPTIVDHGSIAEHTFTRCESGDPAAWAPPKDWRDFPTDMFGECSSGHAS